MTKDTPLYGIVVGRNEAGRYLESMLRHASDLVDELVFYDDQSSDNSLEIAQQFHNVIPAVRPDHVPTFMEHEGRFRGHAWQVFEEVCNPKEGEWVIVIDTDEVLTSTGTNCCLRCEVDQAIKAAEFQGAESVLLPRPEVFGFDADGTPLLRKDGYWGTIVCTRLFRYKPGGVYADKAMGSGCEPVSVGAGKKSPLAYGLNLLHLGYAHEDDQREKFARYTSLLDHGHNPNHINSILHGPRQLERWTGLIPEMIRGVPGTP